MRFLHKKSHECSKKRQKFERVRQSIVGKSTTSKNIRQATVLFFII